MFFEITIKCRYNHYFAFICTYLGEVNEIIKKLSFINTYNIELFQIINADILQMVTVNRLYHLQIMCRYAAAWVPRVCLELDSQAFLSWDLKSFNSSHKFSALSCEHGSNYELDSSSLLLLIKFFQIQFIHQLFGWWHVICALACQTILRRG